MTHPAAVSLCGAATVFVVHDLDGNQICFGMESTQQPATPPEP